jgi:hypothetical protein
LRNNPWHVVISYEVGEIFVNAYMNGYADKEAYPQ